MSIKMKELPISERPYEKLEMYGANSLSNAELLAIIIKTGTKEESSVTIAQKILNLNEDRKNNLKFLQDISINELTKIKGIGKIKAIQLKAVSELTKRMSRPITNNKIKITCPQDVANLLIDELKNEKRYAAFFLLIIVSLFSWITPSSAGGTITNNKYLYTNNSLIYEFFIKIISYLSK